MASADTETVEGSSRGNTAGKIESDIQHVQPTLNVGLIGDVANGKSTLIRAMTGKRTQTHSSEQQKHGMTIRLGFANASILRCETTGCGMYCFRQDEILKDGHEFKCSHCLGPAKAVARVSFIDCPGHAELMATLLSGASAFDAAILAAAANVPCPSPQARQQLEALRVSHDHNLANSVAVVQTKAELIAQQAEKSPSGLTAAELLALHASNAKEKLEPTIAANAQFMPACAPLGLGLEPLAEWLANLPKREGPITGRDESQLGVLRSFDVNFSGKDASKLVGGVIGGSVSGGGSINCGDVLEIRPGIVHTEPNPRETEENRELRPFKVFPLRFTVEEIMTGKVSLPKASSGGLVAFRTTLCPSLCVDDRLVGSVVGPPGTLPPVWGPKLQLTDLNIVRVDSESASTKVLKKGMKIRCHSGSSTTRGAVARVSAGKGRIEINLEKPICAFAGSKVAIEAKPSEGRLSGYILVAYGSISGGSSCCEEEEGVAKQDESPGTVSRRGPREKTMCAEELKEREDFIRDQFLDALSERNQGRESREIIGVPAPMVSSDSGPYMTIGNFAWIAKALNREPSHLQAYLEREGGLSCAKAGENGTALRVRFRGRGFSELIKRIIRRYVVVYVTCRQCKSAKTEFLKNPSKQVELLCRECNARRFVEKMT